MATVRGGVENVAQAWFDSRLARAASGIFMLLTTAVAVPVATWAVAKLVDIDRKLAIIEQTRATDRAAVEQARQSDLESGRTRIAAIESRMAEDRAQAAKAVEFAQQIVRENAAMRATLDSVARDVARLVARDDARSNRPTMGP